jgi:hypothetical protein
MTHDNGSIGSMGLIIGWIFAFFTWVNPSIIPIILSAAASIMACVNYYYQIKKNKK